MTPAVHRSRSREKRPKRVMRVKDRMTRVVATVLPETSVRAAVELMKKRRIRHLPVVDREGRLVGIVTDRDLRQMMFAPAVQDNLENLATVFKTLTAGEIMTWGVVHVRPDTPIRDAARLMHERKVGALPVVERERLVGMLTETDVQAAFHELMGGGDGSLESYRERG